MGWGEAGLLQEGEREASTDPQPGHKCLMPSVGPTSSFLTQEAHLWDGLQTQATRRVII